MAKKPTRQVFVEDGVEYDPYSVSKTSKIPVPVKAILLKYWFAGATYFFFGWGINAVSLDMLDSVLIVGLGLGIFTDLLLNKIFNLLETDSKEYQHFSMFRSKKFYYLFINIAYGLLLSALIAYAYHLINLAIITAKGLGENAKLPLPAEPLLYGVFFLVFDGLFLLAKWLLMTKIIKKIDKKEGEIA